MILVHLPKTLNKINFILFVTSKRVAFNISSCHTILHSFTLMSHRDRPRRKLKILSERATFDLCTFYRLDTDCWSVSWKVEVLESAPAIHGGPHRVLSRLRVCRAVSTVMGRWRAARSRDRKPPWEGRGMTAADAGWPGESDQGHGTG